MESKLSEVVYGVYELKVVTFTNNNKVFSVIMILFLPVERLILVWTYCLASGLLSAENIQAYSKHVLRILFLYKELSKGVTVEARGSLLGN